MKQSEKIRPGYRFGRLTVEEATDTRRGSNIVWRCQCDCGSELLLDTAQIRRGSRTDCGCRTKATHRSQDLTGQRFGKLVAIEPTEKRADNGSVVWKCLCACGNTAEVSAHRLIRGRVRSCGCLSKPPLKEYIGRRFGRLTVTEYAGKIGRSSGMHYWKCRCDCGNETVVGQTELQNGSTQSCGCLQKERVKAALNLIDGTSVAILERTKNGLRRSNKSGCTGVFQDKRSGKWVAMINFKKKRYCLGRYDEKDDAIRARRRGEEMRDEFLDWYYAEIASKPARQEKMVKRSAENAQHWSRS